jgi:protein TonB
VKRILVALLAFLQQVTAAEVPAEGAGLVHAPSIDVPDVARTEARGGRVVIRAFILTDGTVGSAEIYMSSGSPALDQAALDKVKTWRFVPAKSSTGNAVATWVQIPFTFELVGSPEPRSRDPRSQP